MVRRISRLLYYPKKLLIG